MKDNQHKPIWKNIYIVQEQPIKQSNLSAAARSKIINKTGSSYSSQSLKNYGPCIPFNQNCECSLEELQRQEQILRNREIEERVRGQNNEGNQQEINEREINRQNQLNNLQRSFRELQEENRNAVQALGINNLSDLPNLLNGENLTELLNRATRRQSNWWWSSSSTSAELQRITTERNEARDNLQTIQQQLQDEQVTHQQTQRQLADANNTINNLTVQRDDLQGTVNNTRNSLGVDDNLTRLPVLPEGQNLQGLINFYNDNRDLPQQLQQQIDETTRQLEQVERRLNEVRTRLNLNQIAELDNLPQLLQGETINSLLARPLQQQLQAEQRERRKLEEELAIYKKCNFLGWPSYDSNIFSKKILLNHSQLDFLYICSSPYYEFTVPQEVLDRHQNLRKGSHDWWKINFTNAHMSEFGNTTHPHHDGSIHFSSNPKKVIHFKYLY